MRDATFFFTKRPSHGYILKWTNIIRINTHAHIHIFHTARPYCNLIVCCQCDDKERQCVFVSVCITNINLYYGYWQPTNLIVYVLARTVHTIPFCRHYVILNTLRLRRKCVHRRPCMTIVQMLQLIIMIKITSLSQSTILCDTVCRTYYVYDTHCTSVCISIW